jgi:hypothetical protein
MKALDPAQANRILLLIFLHVARLGFAVVQVSGSLLAPRSGRRGPPYGRRRKDRLFAVSANLI